MPPPLRDRLLDRSWRETRVRWPTIAEEELVIRELSARQVAQMADAVRAAGEDTEALLRLTAHLLCLTLHTVDGERVFSDEDADALLDLPVSFLSTVAPEVQAAAGLSAAEGTAKNG